jgi:uncharacterized protein (DUF488 family)
MQEILYTIGHSIHSAERFMALLIQHSISEIIDVRSIPYSKYNSQFNRELLRQALEEQRIVYSFAGNLLGARSKNPYHYINKKVRYNLVAESSEFQQGLKQVRLAVRTNRVALMCAEKDPVMCHRAILVCRNLRDSATEILHILEDGRLERNSDMERRMMQSLRVREQDLFMTHEELVEHAYDLQSERIAYIASPDELSRKAEDVNPTSSDELPKNSEDTANGS